MSTNRSSTSVRAVRGAITAAADTSDEIVAATAELLGEMIARNGIAHDDIVSVVFTATPDLTAEFPAAAGRVVGISDIPLLCATEIEVAGAVGRCVRVLMHVHTERERSELRHVYLRDARQLRTDLPE
ncbi:MAG: chorismate mutase [Actinomycetota bacterium]